MILVTGAAGKTGLTITRALTKKGFSVRAMIHKEEHRESVKKAGAGDVVLGNLLSAEDLIKAVGGSRAIYHIPPNVHPKELEIGELIISAAKGANVDHFVYHSVLHPQIESMPHHWLKMKVEGRLLESGLPFTILQPTTYMQNILSSIPTILEKSTYQIPYPVDTRICLIDLHDVARVAAIVLEDPSHQGAIYELVGTEAFSQREVAQYLERALGKPVQAQQIPLGYWESQAKEAGLGRDQVDSLVKMFQHYQLFGFHGSTKVLSWLLGREPTSLDAFLEREIPRL